MNEDDPMMLRQPQSASRIAATALFVALGAEDDEMDEALRILSRSPVPNHPSEIAIVAKDALALARYSLGNAPI